MEKNVTLKNCIPEISPLMRVGKVDKRVLGPVLMGFFIMGFCDMVAPITGRIALEFPASRQAAVSFLPTMVFLWFLVLSTPLAALMNRIGRKATALIGYAFTVVGLMVPYVAGEGCALGWYFAGFGLLGVGNTAIQVAINPLLATIVPGERMTVLVAMNDEVLGARDVTKMSTTAVQTFHSPNYGTLGYIHNSKVDYERSPESKHTVNTPFNVDKLDSLPKVGIVYAYSNAPIEPLNSLLDAGYQGIVSAGVGNGNVNAAHLERLEKAAKDGVMVVRSSRVPTGYTTRDAEVDDSKYGFVASGTLNPQKARVLLQLALTQTKDPKVIQQYFEDF